MYISIVVLLLIACQIVSGVDIKESATGILFPSTYKGKKQLELAGVGVRVKKIGPIRARVYAVGLYVDKLLTSKRIKGHKFDSANDLLSSADFEKVVSGGDTSEKVFELRMARSVGADTMVQALAESVSPRMQGNDLSSLKKFEGLLLEALKGKGAVQNMVLSFETTPNSLNLKIDGVKKGDIQSPVLSKAFSGVYLDKNAVSPSLRESIAKTVLSWL